MVCSQNVTTNTSYVVTNSHFPDSVIKFRPLMDVGTCTTNGYKYWPKFPIFLASFYGKYVDMMRFIVPWHWMSFAIRFNHHLAQV